MKLKVDVNELDRVFDYLRSINKVELEDIIWLRNGEVVDVDPKDIREWRFVGLNNTEFPRNMGFSSNAY